ncbi:MAG: molybdopterin molybdenumtransferase MoeA, partial [Albidovulum sp.]
MTPFDTVIVVDWSGGGDRGPTPKKDAIWAAAVTANGSEAPVYLRNRTVAEDWLAKRFATEISANRRVIAGFDFPFGYPKGFARHISDRQDPLALWDWIADQLGSEGIGPDRYTLAGRINALFPGTGPFWFNGSGTEIDGLPRKDTLRTGHGMPERREAESRAKGASSCWQMGGAGSVGSQAMTGMASLSRLRARFPDATCVWPFQPLDGPIVMVEVWPSLVGAQIKAATRTGEIKDAAQVRILAQAIWWMQESGVLAGALDGVPPEARFEEGWIFGLGAEAQLRQAAEAAGTASLTPPRLRDDCFAMPQGVSWVPVDEALARLRDGLVPVARVETVKTANAAGRVLASDCVARRSNPPEPNS